MTISRAGGLIVTMERPHLPILNDVVCSNGVMLEIFPQNPKEVHLHT